MHEITFALFKLFLDAGCSKQKGWQPGGDHVHSGIGHADDAYLVLSLKVTNQFIYSLVKGKTILVVFT